jgi:hypothetical protein
VRLDHKVYQDKKRHVSEKRDYNPGNHNGGETPDPIPNSEVKLSGADGTARATWWESRTLPGFFLSSDVL